MSTHDDLEDTAVVPWMLSKKETLHSFIIWKDTLLQFLEEEPVFAPFLKPDLKWCTTSSGTPNRGFQDDDSVLPHSSAEQKTIILNLMLERIAVYCPVINHHYIIKRTTCLDDIWDTVIHHFGFHLEVGFAPNDVANSSQTSVSGATDHSGITVISNEYSRDDPHDPHYYSGDSQTYLYGETDISGLTNDAITCYDVDAYDNSDTEDDSEHEDDLFGSDEEDYDPSYASDIAVRTTNNSESFLSDSDARMQYEMAAIYAAIAANDQKNALTSNISQTVMGTPAYHSQDSSNAGSLSNDTNFEATHPDSDQPAAVSLNKNKRVEMDDHKLEYKKTELRATTATYCQNIDVTQHGSLYHDEVSASVVPSPQVDTMSKKECQMSLHHTMVIQVNAELTSAHSTELCGPKDNLSDIIRHDQSIQCKMPFISTPVDGDKQTNTTEGCSQYQEIDPAHEDTGIHLDLEVTDASGELNSILEDSSEPATDQDTCDDNKCVVAAAASVGIHEGITDIMEANNPSTRHTADLERCSLTASTPSCPCVCADHQCVMQNTPSKATNNSSWTQCPDVGPESPEIVGCGGLPSQVACPNIPSIFQSEGMDRREDSLHPGQKTLPDQIVSVQHGPTLDLQHDDRPHHITIKTVGIPVAIDHSDGLLVFPTDRPPPLVS